MKEKHNYYIHNYIHICIFTFFLIFIFYKIVGKAEYYDKNVPYTISDNWVYEDKENYGLSYMAYIPQEVSDNTKIIIFLHGNGEVKSEWQDFFEKYVFIKDLSTENYIFIIPMEKKKCNWANDVKKLNKIIDAVCTYSGATRESNVYIAGVSSGADDVTKIAGKIEFEGAIYMAGSISGIDDPISARKVAKLWAGKEVYYYRDNLFHHGGYGYDEAYIARLKKYSEDGLFHFYTEDLNWEHDHNLVDAALLPTYYKDAKNQNCHGALDRLFGNEMENELSQVQNILGENADKGISNISNNYLKDIFVNLIY